MKYFTMFSGIGGAELGIQQAYENYLATTERKKSGGAENDLPNDKQKQLATKPFCIGYSEIDKYAIQIYEKHFNHKNYGDATRINAKELPDFDLLFCGFPCQAFSIAGKRRGFDDTRGTLFFDIARVLKEKRPRNFVLENVKGLLSHDGGRTFKTIITTLTELGYCVEWQVLNSKDFGVPQNRERVYIVGHFGGIPEREVFPIGKDGSEYNEVDEQQAQVTGTINVSMSKGGNKQDANSRVLIKQPKIVASRGSGQGAKTGLYSIDTLQYKGLCDKIGVYASTQETNAVEILRILQEKIGEEAFAEWGFGILDSLQAEKVLQPILYGKGIRREADKGKSPMDDGSLSRTEAMPESELLLLWESKNRCSPQEPRLERQFLRELSKGMSELPQQNPPFRIRRLTPLEAERLQGFPDNWTDIVSDTQRYKTLGNAMTVNVVQAVVERLLECGGLQ